VIPAVVKAGETLMTNQFPRILSNAVLAILPLPAAALLFGGDFETLTADGPVPAAPDLAEPVEYAFIIWFPVFMGWIAYAIYQAQPAQRENPLLKKIGWLTAANLIGILLFFVIGRTGPALLMIPVILLQFISTAAAYLIVRDEPKLGTIERRFIQPLLAVNAGWLTGATVLTFTGILPEYGVSIPGPDRISQALFTVTAIVILASFMVWRGRAYLPYSLTLLWACWGITAANLVSPERKPIVIAALVAAGALLLLTAFVQQKTRRSGSLKA
jgi:hypothetical protein